MEEHQTRRPRRKFSNEFKRDAVEILDGLARPGSAVPEHYRECVFLLMNG